MQTNRIDGTGEVYQLRLTKAEIVSIKEGLLLLSDYASDCKLRDYYGYEPDRIRPHSLWIQIQNELGICTEKL